MCKTPSVRAATVPLARSVGPLTFPTDLGVQMVNIGPPLTFKTDHLVPFDMDLMLQASTAKAPIAKAPMRPEKKTKGSKTGALPACVNCRRSKVKCIGGIPCKRCVRLNTESTCVRCQPRKRGRKRKVRASPANNSGWSQESCSKLRKGTTGLPSRSVQDLEMDVVERLAGFTSQFNVWQNSMSNTETCRKRLIYFCAYLRCNILRGTHSTTSQVVRKLASSLQAQVDRFIQTLTADECAVFRKLMDENVAAPSGLDLQLSDLKTDVEREVYKNMPVGTWIINLEHGFFSGKHKPWVNPRICSILGYSQEELVGILNNHDQYVRLLHHSSFCPLSGSFWNAVASGRESFTSKSRFIHKTGRVIDLMATFWIRYNNNVPNQLMVFLQHRDEERSTVRSKHATAVAEYQSQPPLQPNPVSPRSNSSMGMRSPQAQNVYMDLETPASSIKLEFPAPAPMLDVNPSYDFMEASSPMSPSSNPDSAASFHQSDFSEATLSPVSLDLAFPPLEDESQFDYLSMMA